MDGHLFDESTFSYILFLKGSTFHILKTQNWSFIFEAAQNLSLEGKKNTKSTSETFLKREKH